SCSLSPVSSLNGACDGGKDWRDEKFQCQRTNDQKNSNEEARIQRAAFPPGFVIGHSFGFDHSSLVILPSAFRMAQGLERRAPALRVRFPHRAPGRSYRRRASPGPEGRAAFSSPGGGGRD